MYRICRKILGQELWLKYPCFRAVWRAGPEASPRGRGWTACGWGRWRARRGWWGSSTTSSSTSTWWAGPVRSSSSHLGPTWAGVLGAVHGAGGGPEGGVHAVWQGRGRRTLLPRARAGETDGGKAVEKLSTKQRIHNALIVSNIWHPWEAYCLYWHSVGAGDAVAGPEAGHGRPAADGQVRAGQHRRYTDILSILILKLREVSEDHTYDTIEFNEVNSLTVLLHCWLFFDFSYWKCASIIYIVCPFIFLKNIG